MAFLLSLIILFPGVVVAAETTPTVKGFYDDFKGVERLMPDGTKKLYPDHTKWAFTFWPGIRWPDSYGDGTNWLEGNSESQTYVTPWIDKIKGKPVPLSLRYNPFTIEEDGLHITASLLTPAQQKAYHVGGHRRFGSGILLSRYSFRYGEVTIIAKLPSARGSWPALWLLPDSHKWPPEIDIMEGMAWGPHREQVHAGFIAPKGEKGSHNDWFDVGVDLSADFHEYKMTWTEQKISILFDGEELLSQETPLSMKQKMYLLINLAVGGQWPYNEVGIKPIDSIEPERLERGADVIQDDYPATMIVKSVNIKEY